MAVLKKHTKKTAHKKKAAPKKRRKVAVKRKPIARKAAPHKKRKAAPHKKAAPKRKKRISGGPWHGVHNDWERIPAHVRRARTRAKPTHRANALKKGPIGAIHKSHHGLIAVMKSIKNPL